MSSFASDLRTCVRKQTSILSSKPPTFSNSVESEVVGIELRTELLALAALDQSVIQDQHSELNRALKDFFSTCSKLPNYHEAKTPLAFFGGLGFSIFMSMETTTPVKNFRNHPEVKKRLSDIFNLLGISIDSNDLIGNLLHDLRQVIFVLATNNLVDTSALLALIRRSWREVNGKLVGEEFNNLIRTPDKNDFAEAEAAALVDLFSVSSPLSNGASHVDAIE